MFLMRRAERGKVTLRLGDVIDSVGPEGFILVALVVALPFASPLSLGPVTTPASLFLLYVGWMFARGKAIGRVPERWRKTPLPLLFVRTMRRWIIRLSARLRLHQKPVSQSSHQSFSRSCGWGIVVAAVLLGVPIPLLPLTNTFPALGVAAFCLAFLLQSNRWFAAGVGFSVLGSLIFLGLGLATWFLGIEGLMAIIASFRGNV